MFMDSTPLDSSDKIATLKLDFEDDGIMSVENIQFMFDYIEALEMGLQFSAGAGPTQEESDAAEENSSHYNLGSYIDEAVKEDRLK